jgi:Ca-activated chloride channel family protein
MSRILKNFSTTFKTILYVSMACCICGAINAQTAQQSVAPPSVRIGVLVLDNSKHAVTDVKQEELRVLEDGVEQTISLFARDARPLSFALAIDSSGSLRTQHGQVIEAGRKFIRSTGPGDEGFVMRFVDNDHIEVLQDYTSNKTDLLDSLDDIFPEQGATAFVDAVYLAAEKISQHKKATGDETHRRVLVLVTDGDDRGSFYKADKLFKLLRESDVQIFAIGLVDELDKEDQGSIFPRKPRKHAVALLDRLASETGGRVYYPGSPDEVSKAVSDLVSDLRAQYVIGYSTAPNKKSKSYRKVSVSMAGAKETRAVIARTGYTVSSK